jgi:cyclic-di-GMP phosphodiesterase TipF (flagellum assembly factor)
MIRLGAIFVAVCVVLIAVSLGAAAYLYLGLSGVEASILTIAALTGLALYNTVATRLRDRSDIGAQIADLSRGSADLAQQVAEFGRRLAAIESKVDSAAGKPSGPDPLAAEIDELGALMQQLAETVARHEAAIRSGGSVPAPLAVHAPIAEPVAVAAPPPEPTLAEIPRDEPAESVAAGADPKMIETVRSAVEAGRIDLYLQPIVTLPQRKVRYYEALSRMRDENGDVIPAAEFIGHAEAAGVMPRIDNLALYRSVQVVRRLMMKSRDNGMFCNLAGSTHTDEEFFPQLIEFVDANRALASSLVFEFRQVAVREFGPVEHESLAALAERGFRFSMDQVTSLRFDPRELSERGFRFVKVPAVVLLNHVNSGSTDIHPEDLSDLLARHGIDLIASMVESEGSVLDLLDFEVRFGQGLLFSPPRPVRQEALRGAPDRGAGVARERAVRDDRPAERSGGKPQGGLGQLARTAVGPA